MRKAYSFSRKRCKRQFLKKQCKSQTLKNNTAKGAYSRTRMKRQTHKDYMATGKLREQSCKKQTLKQNTAKGKFSRTRMQRQACKTKNAKTSSQELQCKRKVTWTINAKNANSLAQYIKRKVSSNAKGTALKFNNAMGKLSRAAMQKVRCSKTTTK